MAGFNALAEQVRDPGRDPSQRRQALRKCLERFAPYGHRATWHHLCARAGISPDDRYPDPQRLVAALEELEEARAVWLAYERAFAQRRRMEKHDGIRQPPGPDDWHRRCWGGRQLLPVENPDAAPGDRLADVLRRLIDEVQSRGARAAHRSHGAARVTAPRPVQRATAVHG